MVPVQRLSLEHNVGNDGKYGQGYALLYNLQLYQREWSPVADKAQSVGRYLTTILEEGNAPRESNHPYEWPVGTDSRLR